MSLLAICEATSYFTTTQGQYAEGWIFLWCTGEHNLVVGDLRQHDAHVALSLCISFFCCSSHLEMERVVSGISILLIPIAVGDAELTTSRAAILQHRFEEDINDTAFGNQNFLNISTTWISHTNTSVTTDHTTYQIAERHNGSYEISVAITTSASNTRLSQATSAKVSMVAPTIEATYRHIHIFGTICIAIPGLLGNTLTYMTLSRRFFSRQSIFLYCRLLAVADSIVLLHNGLNRVVYILEGNPNFIYSVGCKLGYFLLHFTSMYSAWIMVLMTTERFLRHRFPTKTKSYCTKRAAGTAAGLCGVMIAAVNAHYFFTWSNGVDEYGFATCTTRLESNVVTYITIMEGVMYAFLPSFIIALLNCMIVIVLFKYKASTSIQNSVVAKSAVRVTFTLLLITTIFVTTTILTSIYFAMRETFMPVTSIDAIFQTIPYLNHSCNFPIYLASVQSFREEFCQMIGCDNSASSVGPTGGVQVLPAASWSNTHFAGVQALRAL